MGKISVSSFKRISSSDDLFSVCENKSKISEEIGFSKNDLAGVFHLLNPITNNLVIQASEKFWDEVNVFIDGSYVKACFLYIFIFKSSRGLKCREIKVDERIFPFLESYFEKIQIFIRKGDVEQISFLLYHSFFEIVREIVKDKRSYEIISKKVFNLSLIDIFDSELIEFCSRLVACVDSKCDGKANFSNVEKESFDYNIDKSKLRHLPIHSKKFRNFVETLTVKEFKNSFLFLRNKKPLSVTIRMMQDSIEASKIQKTLLGHLLNRNFNTDQPNTGLEKAKKDLQVIYFQTIRDLGINYRDYFNIDFKSSYKSLILNLIESVDDRIIINCNFEKFIAGARDEEYVCYLLLQIMSVEQAANVISKLCFKQSNNLRLTVLQWIRFCDGYEDLYKNAPIEWAIHLVKR